jgi:uncharacterized membrane protein
MKLTLYFYALAVFLVFDGLWLGLIAKSFYQKHLGFIMGPVNWYAAGIFYLLFIAGVTLFVTSPAMNNGTTLAKVFGLGFIFGLICYATYDLTNQATIKNWPMIVTLADLAWGGLITGTVSVVTVWLLRMGK